MTRTLDAIRERDRTPQRADEDVTQEHADAAADRRWLLEYIDAIDNQVKSLGEAVDSALEVARIALGLKLLADGHAPSLGAAIELTKDLARMRELYPEPDE